MLSPSGGLGDRLFLARCTALSCRLSNEYRGFCYTLHDAYCPLVTLTAWLSLPSCHTLHVQAIVESFLKEYPNVLTLRVRMPIVADLTYPRNFITKIIKYEKVRCQGRLCITATPTH